MRIALVTAATATTRRGNFSTTQRWIRHNSSHDVVCVTPNSAASLNPIPDIVHGYHAVHGGQAALTIARRHERPLVVSLGGTDLQSLMARDPQAPGIERILRAACCVTGAFDSFGEICADLLGRPKPFEYVTVPRSVAIPDCPPPQPVDDVLRVLLPAGLRPVKDPMHAIELAEALVARGLPIDLTILGPTDDPAYARRLQQRAAALDFVHFRLCPIEDVHLAYTQADVCWNTSIQEGGANAILEGLAHGCALYVRNVLGNHDFFDYPGSPATLFDAGDLDGAEQFHRAILQEPLEDRLQRVAATRSWLREHYCADDEMAALNHAWNIASTARPLR